MKKKTKKLLIIAAIIVAGLFQTSWIVYLVWGELTKGVVTTSTSSSPTTSSEKENAGVNEGSLSTGISAVNIIQESSWKNHSHKSEADDSLIHVLTVDADRPFTGWPREEVEGTLIIRCKEKELNIFINTGMSANPELGLHDQATVRLRFDTEKPFRQTWREGTSNDALFASNPHKFLAQILKHKKLWFEFTPFSSSPSSTTFDLRGALQATKAIRKACKVKITGCYTQGCKGY